MAKYSVRPADQTPLPPPPPDDKHGLHTVLRNALTERPVVLNFQVQLRRSEEMPIDDATVLWSEEESPFVTVATLRFPQQDIDRPTLQGARQALAFNVWHALEIHRPMGSLNRVRLYAYHKSVEWRNHCRDIPEPSGLAQFD